MQSVKVLDQAMGRLSKHAVKQVDRLLSTEGIHVERFFGYWVAYMVGAHTPIQTQLYKCRTNGEQFYPSAFRYFSHLENDTRIECSYLI